jgi:hypothetical protein
MNSDVIESDPISKISTIFHPTADGDKYIIEERQDAEDVVEANKYLYNQFDQRATFKGDGLHRVANIPLVVLMDCYKKGLFRGATLTKEDKAWLNDKDNQYFRTRPGSL